MISIVDLTELGYWTISIFAVSQIIINYICKKKAKEMVNVLVKATAWYFVVYALRFL
jgi:hypothetical protein